MMSESAGGDEWILRPSTAGDVEMLMEWFPTRDDVEIWGGPTFRFPFSRASFCEDINWGRIRSFSLFDPAATFAAFGQLYKRQGRIHLARLVARPEMRGQGVGKRLIRNLMTEGRRIYSGNEYSLFVFRENRPARECYKSLGFVVGDYPDDMPYADVCDFLTRPLKI